MSVTTEQMMARRFMDEMADEALALAERKHLSINDAIAITQATFNLLINLPDSPTSTEEPAHE